MQEVWKKCNVRAEGCDDKYNLYMRVEEIKYDVFKDTSPRYDACSNPLCQSHEFIKTNKSNRKKRK